MQVFVEAFIVGLLILITGLLVSGHLQYLVPKLPDECKDWNKNNVMEMSLFISGVAGYLLFRAINNMDNRKI
jgi:hypothetical protein